MRNYAKAKTCGYTIIGYGYYQQSNYSQALLNFKEALVIEENAGREKLNGSLMNTIGVMYVTLGNLARALEYYERALKVCAEMDVRHLGRYSEYGKQNGIFRWCGRVNISQTTYELLKDDADFAFETRGKIEAKGKGEMEMWFVQIKTEEV